MKKKNKGMAITEYMVPTVLLGLVFGLGMYSFGTNDLLMNFFLASTGGKVDLENHMAILGNENEMISSGFNKPQAGQLGGTALNPVEQCTSGTCVVDYGNFVINAVPEDLEKTLEDDGAVSTKEKLAGVISQLAEQATISGNKICEPGVTPEQCSEDLAKLSNMMNLEADLNRFVEETVKSGVDRRTFNRMFFKKKFKDLNWHIPDKYKGLIKNFDENKKLSDIFGKTGFGEARNSKILKKNEFKNRSDKEITYALVDQFDKVTDNPKYSAEVRDLTKKIYLDMADISYNMGLIYDSNARMEHESVQYDYYDPLSGARLDKIDMRSEGKLDNIVKPGFARKMNRHRH